MSVYVTSSAWMHSKASGTTLLVLLAISDNAHDDGRAWPSVAYLARKSRVSERTAQYAIRELSDLGEVVVEMNAGPRGCNVYAVQVNKLRAETLAPSPKSIEGGAMGCTGADSAGVQPSVEGGATGCTRNIKETTTTTKGAPTEKVPSTEKPKVDFDFDAGSFVGPIGDHIGRWSAAFPALDVGAEVLRAGAWLSANPKNRKSNYLAFLTNWMSRAQDRAPRPQPSGVRPHGNQFPTNRRDRNASFASDILGAAFD